MRASRSSVTNQSGIARGYFTEAFVRETHALLENMLRKRGRALTAFITVPITCGRQFALYDSV
jgi:D-glycero-D-manno-heptose 1,7-bisphosphate phosphatase